MATKTPRATWPEDTITARALLASLGRRQHLRPDELDRVEAQKLRVQPPEDKWADR